MREILKYSDLFNSITSGAAIITSNQRLARHLHSLYEEDLIKSGKGAWKTPTICSLDSWVLDFLKQLSLSTLNLHQTHYVWESVIREDLKSSGRALLNLPSLVALISQASQLMSDYKIENSDQEFTTEEEEAFLKWRTLYFRRCKKLGRIPTEMRFLTISGGFTSGELTAPKKIVWTGFDDWSPAIKELQSILTEKRVKQLVWAPPPKKSVLQLAGSIDIKEEVRNAAIWARICLEKGDKKIGIVVHELEKYRLLIDRLFSEELIPQAALIESDSKKPFNISLGLQLSSFEVIQTAIMLLRLNPDQLYFPEISKFLRSPYVGEKGDDVGALANLEVKMRDELPFCCTVDELIQFLSLRAKRSNPVAESGLPRPDGLPPTLSELRRAGAMTERIRTWNNTYKKTSTKKMPSELLSIFEEILQSLGWPGIRVKSSLEFQVLNAWNQLMESVASMDAVSSPMTWSQFQRLISDMVSRQLFQPKSMDVPIQILGELESVGHQFDSLRVLGLDERHFPPPANPNPFLPFTLMKRLNMPRATVEREHLYAKEILDRLCESGNEVVLSWSSSSDGEYIRPSALLLNKGKINSDGDYESVSCAKKWIGSASLEKSEDVIAPKIVDFSKSYGGTAILKSQSHCPFQGFAYHRLGAKPLQRPQMGIDPKSRGILIHHVLEKFWNEIKTLSQLKETSNGDRSSLLITIINNVWAENKGLHQGPKWYQEKVARIEKERTFDLMLKWLEKEEERAEFEVIKSEESSAKTIFGLPIRVQVDRIDQLESGEKVVVDYKTGRSSLSDMLGERLKEVQLPIYAHFNSEKLAGIAYGEIRNPKPTFKGIAKSTETLPIKKSRLALDWDEQLGKWNEQLSELVSEFISGNANVDPIQPGTTCRMCKLYSFCQAYEHVLAYGDGEE